MQKLKSFLSGPPELHKVVASGEIANVRLLLQKKTKDVDQVEEGGKRTALHIAASAGYDIILGELLDRKARTNIQDKDDHTPLHLAALGGHTRCVQLLLGSRNSEQNKQAALQLRNADGLTPMMAAAAAGHAAVVDLLIRSGVDMYGSVLQGRVSIGHLAARGGHIPVLAVLASHGFNLNTDTLDMNTLLHDAALHGHVAAVSWLLAAGVDPTRRNFDQKSALDLARAEQHHAVVQVLRNAAAAAAGETSGVSAASMPTAAAPAADGVCDVGMVGPPGRQQQQKQQQLGSSLPVYPEDETYKFYPAVDRRPHHM